MFKFTGDVELSDKTKRYLEEKTSKIVKEVGEDNLREIHIVTKNRDGNRIKVELNVYTLDGFFRNDKEGEDLREIYPKLAKNVLNQIRQYRKKRKDIYKERRREKKENIKELELKAPEEEIGVKQIPAIVMNVDQAILEMDAVGHDFYLYKDKETQKPAVVYKKKNGKHGIIELI